MKCICYNKKISLLQENSLKESKIVFKREQRIVRDRVITLDAGSEMWNGGIVGLISAGYGSNTDGDEFIIAICDECLATKKDNGTVAVVGNYMSGAFHKNILKNGNLFGRKTINKKRLI